MHQPVEESRSLWRATLVGLVIASVVLALNSYVDGGKELSGSLNASPAETATYFIVRLIWLPIVLVLIAIIRSRFGKEKGRSLSA
jgi:H+/Cl- antiporter ClcA